MLKLKLKEAFLNDMSFFRTYMKARRTWLTR